MIRRLQASNFRCLQDVSQELNAFEVLVGPNASGKTTFLDLLGFLSDMFSLGLDAAVEKRSQNFHDLVWGRKAASFMIEIEALIPPAHRRGTFPTISYKLHISLDVRDERKRIDSE